MAGAGVAKRLGLRVDHAVDQRGLAVLLVLDGLHDHPVDGRHDRGQVRVGPHLVEEAALGHGHDHGGLYALSGHVTHHHAQ
ncbi:hypothetical protein D3C86_1018730 [compost metagenome]